MNEVIFSVEEDSEGGYVAQALGVSIVTQADTIEDLHETLGSNHPEVLGKLHIS